MRMLTTVILAMPMTFILWVIVRQMEQAYGFNLHWAAVYAITTTAAVLIVATVIAQINPPEDDDYE